MDEQGPSGDEVIRLVAEPDAGRIDRYLAAAVPTLSRSRVQALIREGDVTVGGQATRASLRLRGGEVLEIKLPPIRPTELQPEPMRLDIRYEDRDLLVVYKPAGMVVHPARGHREGTLVHGLLHAVPDLMGIGGVERPGIVHRLDKGTSGVLVVAKHDISLRRLQAQFIVHTVERRYIAVVHGVVQQGQGCVVSRLARHPRDRLRFASTEEGGKRAVTHWRRLGVGRDVSLLACRLETGRTHQIRVHLSESGHPIVGDPLYGRRRRQFPAHLEPCMRRLNHQLLHAGYLEFRHPVHERRLSFVAEPPEDFLRFCQTTEMDVPALDEVDMGAIIPTKKAGRGT